MSGVVPVAARALRLEYLDGIRAFAALVVVFQHAYGFAIGAGIGEYPKVFRPLYASMLYAHYAVDVFIVLSGYCLMLPVVRSPGERLVPGFGGYIRRRAKRILPPYYAAFVLATLVILRFGPLAPEAPRLSLAGIGAHLVLAHNLYRPWSIENNPVLWSVATEWQIYFLFPALLLPLWRRFGAVATVAAALVLTVTPYALVNDLPDVACPWYLALFAMGMAAAAVNFSNREPMIWVREHTRWDLVPVVLPLAGLVLVRTLLGGQRHWLSDPILGLLVATGLVYCAETHARRGSLPGPLRVLEHGAVLWLGTFAYSLYLVHHPFLTILRRWIPLAAFSPTARFVLVLPAEIVVSVLASYLFFLAFERPFSRPRAATHGRSTASAPGDATAMPVAGGWPATGIPQNDSGSAAQDDAQSTNGTSAFRRRG